MGFSDQRLERLKQQRGALLMGILNVTPDSFFDGGRFFDPRAAARRIEELCSEGADIIDIGAESTRPGATPVPAEEQIRRLKPVVDVALGLESVLVSIDTRDPLVAAQMLEAGAHVINDVSCLHDDALARVTAQHGAKLIVMHSRGAFNPMAGFSMYPDEAYTDVVRDVASEWRVARARALERGMASADVWFDPGLGFTKNAHQSLELLARLDEFVAEGAPIVVGPSRKSFIAEADARNADARASAAARSVPPEERLGGTIAASLAAIERGADVLRVHDVGAVRQALAVRSATLAARRDRPAHAVEARHA